MQLMAPPPRLLHCFRTKPKTPPSPYKQLMIRGDCVPPVEKTIKIRPCTVHSSIPMLTSDLIPERSSVAQGDIEQSSTIVRRLAAVAFADVAGWSLLMENND